MSPALSNAVGATITEGPFWHDLAQAVTNDGAPDKAAAWAIRFAEDFLRRHGQVATPIAAYDFAMIDFERLAMIWPAARTAAESCPIPADHILPALAKFMVERLPAIWEGPRLGRIAPVTLSLALADRIDTLVSMFAAGLKPNGSKDPFALRRAAKEALQCMCFSQTLDARAAHNGGDRRRQYIADRSLSGLLMGADQWLTT